MYKSIWKDDNKLKITSKPQNSLGIIMITEMHNFDFEAIIIHVYYDAYYNTSYKIEGQPSAAPLYGPSILQYAF